MRRNAPSRKSAATERTCSPRLSARPRARSGTTSLDDTANLGEPCHTDVHVHKKTIRLKDGRRLNENGWVDFIK